MKSKRTNHKFSSEEDLKLAKLVREYGENAWDDIANEMKGRNIRQCKDRWIYYLSPNINNSPWTEDEDKRLLKLCKQLDYKWVKIAKHFYRRNDTQIKNRWNYLKKERNLPDYPRSRPRRNQEVKEITQEEPVKAESTPNISAIFSKVDETLAKIDTVFPSLDSNVTDLYNEFLF